MNDCAMTAWNWIQQTVFVHRLSFQKQTFIQQPNKDAQHSIISEPFLFPISMQIITFSSASKPTNGLFALLLHSTRQLVSWNCTTLDFCQSWPPPPPPLPPTLPNKNKKPILKQLTAGIQKGKEHTTVKNEQTFIFNPLRTPKRNEHILLVTVTSEGVTQHGCWGDPDSLLAWCSALLSTDPAWQVHGTVTSFWGGYT